jgi:hypothetical protein
MPCEHEDYYGERLRFISRSCSQLRNPEKQLAVCGKSQKTQNVRALYGSDLMDYDFNFIPSFASLSL